MSKSGKATYQELEARVLASEAIVEALKRHEVDAVVGEDKITFLLLREVGQALQTSDTEFRAMFELPGIGMIMADSPAFHFTRVNQKFCEITGYTAKELLAKTYIGLTDPRDRPGAMNALAQVLRGKADSWAIEKRCFRKDGTVIWVAVHGVAMRDETGRAVRIMAMISDLTPRKQARASGKPVSKRRSLTGKKPSVRSQPTKR